MPPNTASLPERIRQIEAKAMQKLRGFLAEKAEAV
uniref:Uncharacterized protein n=1 Tax=Neisseria meningitidis alpha275 TaxID=295996 RepID=C6SLN9_NEIME|nr:hypothetical protein predicted by Glimmer/Critica [Neisseria meningitidis alpha275]